MSQTVAVQCPAKHHSLGNVGRETSATTLNKRGVKGALRNEGESYMAMIVFQEVRSRINMDAVLNMLRWSPLSCRGSEERGQCPVHCSTNPRSRSFSVDRRGNRFQCFSCGAKGNQLDLFAQVRKLELYEAAVELCRLVGIDVPYIGSQEQRRGARPAAASLPGGAQVAPNRASPPSEHRQADQRLLIDNQEGECTWRV